MKKLIEYAEKFILKNDLKKISLKVLKNNQAALSFFEKNGYTIIEKKKYKKVKMLKYL